MNTNHVPAIIAAIEQLSASDREKLEKWFQTHAYLGEEEHENDGDSVREPTTAYTVSRKHRRMSVEEYLHFEAHSPIKHEYIDGEVFAMAGASLTHHRIAGNVFNAFSNHLRGGPCEAFMAEFKVRLQVHRKDIFYYPDVMVACGREDIEKYHLTNPKVIVEVLSPSTQKTDLREKAFNYREIASLEEYALIAQDRYEVAIQRRTAGWDSLVLTSPDSVAEFRAIELSLPLSWIYERALP